ncbi:type I-C CRISPR-associated endonuclease Cas1c [Acidisoma cladoniae]|uniref:type I-C CRISPR-associated endonuclease Cas1c n=1 Tax=Acidisoma cladoniae TaxID=3040935 RepID=UPI00254B1B00|nr:type I-C CRISPR-associated endonuclease Cas1c [Acidisoma sp. PAMC 29798]
MRKLLNTLYVSTEGAYLRRDGLNVVVEVERVEKLRVPLHLLGSVAVFGQVSLSPALMGSLAEAGIVTAFFGTNGRFLARVEGPVSGNVLLRREQYRVMDDGPDCTRIARAIVAAKSLNQRSVLQRALRDHGSALTDAARDAVIAAIDRMQDIARRALHETDLDRLRGHEGEAAALYFGVFGHALRVTDPALAFRGRSRRPPMDVPNALLSFLYTLLVHDCRGALEGVGLDPAAGFLHRMRPGRPSLALDLMEELRAPLADRLALSMLNRRELVAGDFRIMENGAVLLAEDSRKTVLTAWQERKREEIEHPFLKERTSLGLLPHLQASLLARALRGDLDTYPALIWR